LILRLQLALASFVLFSSVAFAQRATVDSLRPLVDKEPESILKLDLMKSLALAYRTVDIDSSSHWYIQIEKLLNAKAMTPFSL